MWLSVLYKVFSNYKPEVAISLLIIIIGSFSIVSISPYNVSAQLQKQQSLQIAKHSSYSILIEKGIDLVYNQGNYTEAIKYFDSVLSVDPTNIDAIFYKGAALSSLGKSSEAVPFINKAIMLPDKALTTDPNNIDLLSIKGRALNRLANYMRL